MASGAPVLNLGPSTYYFRTEFPYTPAAGTLELSLESLVDDGAVYYLNGVEVYRQNLPAGSVEYATLASTAVGTASLGGAVTIPAASLVPGNNILAVEVHQAAVADADAAFNARLISTVTPLPPIELPRVVFNEVDSGLDATFQVEILNQGNQSVDLAGYAVSISDAPARQYVLPAQTLAPGGHLALAPAQLGFDANAGDHLFLYGPGGDTLLDGVTVRDRLRGRSTAHQGRWLYPDVPTFGAANSFDFHDEVVINEIMYHHAPVVAAPPLIDTEKSVPLGSTWSFDQSGVDLGTAWRQSGFNDTAWSSGAATFGASSGLSYNSLVLSDEPTAYWRLGENPTTGTALDSAPLAGNQNGTYRDVTTRAAVIGGDANLAADFSVKSRSRVSGTGLDATGVVSGDWSIEAWFVRDTVTQYATLFSNNGAPGNTNGPAMTFINNTNRLGLPAVGTSTANVSLDLGPSHLGKPVYAVITKTGGNAAGTNTITIHAWVDGVPLTPVSGSTTWNLAPHDAYFIGRYRSIGLQYFDGAIDEVALYNRALTPAEIAAHAQAGFAGVGVATPLNIGPTTYYFRNEFSFTGDPSITAMELRTVVADGAVFYLNGQEVYRQNMPAGVIGASTTASSKVGAAMLSSVIPIVGPLNAGLNVLAVEVHQADPSGQDVKFDAELIATGTVRPAQLFAESDEEWIELYNRSATSIDLAGWKLDEGIDFTFPSPSTLAPGEYLVVAKDAASLAAKYPTIRIVGNYNKTLSNDGERIVLKDDRNNPADEVQYYESGNWPERADGGGSSLELRDPDADNAKAEAWAASDESDKSPWRTYTTRRIAQPYLGSFASPVGGNVPPAGFNEFVFGLLDVGEVLIDDISLIETPGGTPQQLIQNGSFQSDAIGSAPATWRSGGTQLATVVTDPTDAANRVMRIVSTGATGYIGNDVETTLVGNRRIVTGREYEVSFRAKWIGGSSQLNNRAYFTLIPDTTVLDTPQSNGTPGARNSHFSPNIGPTYSEFRHQPIVPEVGQSVTVSVVADDPDGVSAVTLHWSANGVAWNNLPMSVGPNGVYAASIPGQAGATVIQFFVEAADTLGAVSTFPAAGLTSRALYEVNDGAADPAATLGVDSFRIIMTTADSDKMHAITNLMSTADLGGTLIVNERDVFYDVGVRLKGSQHSRSTGVRVGFILTLPPDQLLRGVHRTVGLDRSSRSPGTPKPSPDEIIIKQFMNHAGGLASEYDDIAYVVAPRSGHNSVATLQMARLGPVYLDSQFDNGDASSIYEFEMIFTAAGTNGGSEGQKLHSAGPFWDYDVEDLGPDKEVYRFHMQKENNRAEDDFSRIIALGQALELSGPALDAAASQVLDADQWMRTFAARSLIMDFDGYGTTAYRHNHNLKFYVRPEDQKVLAFLWDIDGAFNLSTTGALWPQGGPDTLTKLIERPDNLHRFYGHLHDMISTTWNSTYLGPWMTSYSTQAGQNLSANLGQVQQRANFVLSQLPPQTPFVVSDTIEVPGPMATLGGSGWINVREIRVQGRPEAIPVTWLSPTSWQATVAVQPGTHVLTLVAYDFQGSLIGTDMITVTSTLPNPVVDSLRITEINYNPADPSVTELSTAPRLNNDDFEFLQLENVGASSINLFSTRFDDGIDLTFPSIDLAPGESGVVVRDQAAFELRYGTSVNVLGQYDGSLRNGGENLTLRDSQGQVVLDFSYNDNDPWPEAADGAGATLELINPTDTPADQFGKYYNWRASTEFGGTPDGNGSGPIGVVINEVLTHTDLPATDSIELLNTTAGTIDVSGWLLSDSDANFVKFEIAANTMLGPGEYLVFDEDDFNPTPLTPGPQDFALSGARGDQVWLVIPDGSGGITSIVDQVSFGAAALGESFGRTPNGTGRLAPMSNQTLDAANAAPRVGPVIVSEINYNPDPSPVVAADREFIEVYNPTGSAVDLTEWRVRGGISYDFAPGTTLGAGEILVVVPFNPDNAANADQLAAFRTHYGIDGSVSLLGGYTGQLNNGLEEVRLQRPDEAPFEDPTFVPRLTEDEVIYDDIVPWPITNPGGNSLQRNSSIAYGNDAASWSTDLPTPGTFTGTLLGDFNSDMLVNATDIDLLMAEIHAGTHLASFDLTGDIQVTDSDADHLVQVILMTNYGDTDLDGDVDTRDLTNAIINFTSAGGSGKAWANGDTDGDGDVDTGDLTRAIINFTGAGVSGSLLNVEHPTSNGQVSTMKEGRKGKGRRSSVEHPTPNTQHPTPNTQHPTPNTQHPTPNFQRRMKEMNTETKYDLEERLLKSAVVSATTGCCP